MPTPFMHLQIAEKMQAHLAADSTAESEFLLGLLRQSWPAFYLGQVAPDVQGTAGLTREATHFYATPPEPDNMAYPRLLAHYPALADVTRMSLPQALFVAGYAAHLLLDLIWFREILVPIFLESPNMGEMKQRWLLHHLLLAYLDGLALAALPPTAVTTLSAAQPQAWLPFVADQHLCAWRDRLAAQLQPGAPLETGAYYARLLHMTPDEFTARLADPVWLADHFFPLVPLERVQARLETAVTETITVVQTYLQPLIPKR